MVCLDFNWYAVSQSMFLKFFFRSGKWLCLNFDYGRIHYFFALMCKQFAKISFLWAKELPLYEKNFFPNPNLGLEITCKPHTTRFSKQLSNEAVEFDCSQSINPIPHNSPNSCQQRQSNSTVPNQTAPCHTILQTAVSRSSRIRLIQIRIPHTTQFSKPGIQWDVEFDCSKPEYPIPHNSPNRCRPGHVASVLAQFHAMMICEKKQTFKVWCSFCDKALSSKYVYNLEVYKHNLISIIGSFFNIQHAFFAHRSGKSNFYR